MLHILSEDICPLRDTVAPLQQEFTFGTNKLMVNTDSGATGCGGKVWPAGLLLAQYAVKTYNRPLKVIDLGSGTGLVGLALALANPDCTVFLTDQEVMLPLLGENIALNKLENTFAKLLDWSQPLPQFAQDVDLVLAADCVYAEDAFDILLETMLRLSEQGAPIILSYTRRRKANKKFFGVLKKSFEVQQIEVAECPKRTVLFMLKRRLV